MTLPWIGEPIDRVDGPLKVTGRAQYAAEARDLRPAHARLVLSTIASGSIRRIDTLEAERAPGVLHVMTHENAPSVRHEQSTPADHDLLVLQNDRIHHDRQPVALVVAETLEQAAHAASLVRVEYEPAEPVTRIESAPQYEPEEIIGEPAQHTRGDPERAFAESPVRVQATYTTPVEHHNPIEPHVTIAHWDGDRLTVHDSTQGISRVRSRLAFTFGIPEEHVRVISLFVGGGFGTKGSVWPHVVLAAMAAKAVGRSVKLELTRAQMFGSTGYRPVTIQTISLGAELDGRVRSIAHDTLTQTAEFAQWIESSGFVSRSLYASPNLRMTHRVARLNVSKPSFMRAPGEASGSFALESAMDELAYACGLDPIDLRLINYAGVDPDNGKPFSSKSLHECYRLGAARIEWKERDPRPRSMHDGSKLVGIGMATATYPAWRAEASARIRMDADGNVLVQSGTQDLGTGSYTVFSQVAAHALNVRVERVRFELGDTRFPRAPLSAGSSSAASVGNAVLVAARALADRILALEKIDPSAALPDPDYAAILRKHRCDAMEATATARGSEEDEYSTNAFGAQFAQVEVDEDFGEIRVTKFVGAFAGGRVLNGKLARSQLIGGIVWGIGMALLEHTAVDARTGRVMNATLSDYLVPVNGDVRSIEAHLVEEQDSLVNPLGAKGLGEIGITGAAAAIANAVFHATGKRVRDLPITCDKLL
jgi:xanthine dehydrogenase YagR molybdenum-binding subunit